jgi:hypothetical protein
LRRFNALPTASLSGAALDRHEEERTKFYGTL